MCNAQGLILSSKSRVVSTGVVAAFAFWWFLAHGRLKRITIWGSIDSGQAFDVHHADLPVSPREREEKLFESILRRVFVIRSAQAPICRSAAICAILEDSPRLVSVRMRSCHQSAAILLLASHLAAGGGCVGGEHPQKLVMEAPVATATRPRAAESKALFAV